MINNELIVNSFNIISQSIFPIEIIWVSNLSVKEVPYRVLMRYIHIVMRYVKTYGSICRTY